jgi:hypothetical protein
MRPGPEAYIAFCSLGGCDRLMAPGAPESGEPEDVDMRRPVRGLLLAALGIGALPLAAYAGEVEATFEWVPVQNGGTQTASGTLVLTLPSFAAATDPYSPNGQYYASPTYSSNASAEAALSSLTFSFGNGVNVAWGTNTPDATLSFASLSDPLLPTGAARVWATDDGLITPQVQSGQTAAPQGNYLITGFQLSGQTTTGATVYFDVANSSGSVYSPGPAEDYNGITGGISDDGFWELQSITPVPLPAALPLLIGGLGLLGAAVRRRAPAA